MLWAADSSASCPKFGCSMQPSHKGFCYDSRHGSEVGLWWNVCALPSCRRSVNLWNSWQTWRGSNSPSKLHGQHPAPWLVKLPLSRLELASDCAQPRLRPTWHLAIEANQRQQSRVIRPLCHCCKCRQGSWKPNPWADETSQGPSELSMSPGAVP